MSWVRIIPLLILLFTVAKVHSEEVVQGTLANGLQVHVQSDGNLSLVTLNMYFAAGRATDPDSLAGLAHLAEHLLTESSQSHPDGELLRQSTLYSTYRNAYTSGGHVQFETQCLPAFLPQVIALEAERMRPAVLDEATFERERSIVLEELSYRRRLSVWNQHQERVLQACYSGHLFGEEIAGTAVTVGAIGLEDYEWFCREFIRPARAALVIRGPVDPNATFALVDSLLGGGPESESVSLLVPDYPPVRSTQMIADSPDFEGFKLSVACRIPLDTYENIAFAGSVARMLESAPFGINTVWLPGEVLVFFNGSFQYRRAPKDLQQHYATFYPRFDASQDAQSALEYIWRGLEREMEDLHEGDLYTERLEAAMAEPLSFQVGMTLISGDDLPDEDEAHNTLAVMARERFTDLVHEYLTPSRAGVGITHGRDSERQQAYELAERVAREEDIHVEDALSGLDAEEVGPVLEAYREAKVDPVYSGTLSNGIPFIYLQVAGEEKVRLGGSRVLPPLKIQRCKDKPGIVLLYRSVVNWDDRQKRHPDDPDYRPKHLPFDYYLSLGPGTLSYSASSPTDKVDRLAYHLARRLESEKFNQEVWSWRTRSGRESLERYADNPGLQAQGWRWEQVFGKDYYDLGYFFPNQKTMDKLKYKDLQKLHRTVAGETGQTILYGTGSYGGEMVQAEFEKHFGPRGRFRSYDGEIPETVLAEGTPGRVVYDPGRGDILLELTLPPTSAHRGKVVGVLLLEALLDQAMTSRLREETGLTYGVGVSYRALSGLVLWEIWVTCQPGQAPLALEEVRRVMTGIRDGGFSDDEIARARLALTGRLIRAFDDSDKGFALLRNLGSLGGPVTNLTGRVASFPPEDLNSLARSLIDPDRFTFTATGPMFEEDIDQFD